MLIIHINYSCQFTGNFLIADAGGNNVKGNGEHHEQGDNEDGHGNQGDNDGDKMSHNSGRRGSEEHTEEDNEEILEEITSPTSCAKPFFLIVKRLMGMYSVAWEVAIQYRKMLSKSCLFTFACESFCQWRLLSCCQRRV